MDEALTVAPPAPPELDYPRHWEADVIASDGGVVHLRPMLPCDADAILAFHARLSERTRYLRYFGPYPHISERDLKRFTVVDHHARVALVAWLGNEIIAVGRYEGRFGPDSTEVEGPAEVAFVVRDDHQSRGLGSILLEHLTAAGRERGVRRFEAEVLAELGHERHAGVVVDGGEPLQVPRGDVGIWAEIAQVAGPLGELGVEGHDRVGVARQDRAKVHHTAVGRDDVGLPVPRVVRLRRGGRVHRERLVHRRAPPARARSSRPAVSTC